MVARLFLFFAALCLSVPAFADDHDPSLEGHWAFRIGDATIFVFSLEQQDDGGWEGAWTRPAEIDSNGVIFRAMAGQQTVRPLSTSERDGGLQLTFAGPGDTARNDVLRFRQSGENRAELNYVGIPGDPYPLVRVAPDTPLGPFDEVRIYDRDHAVTEAEYVAQAEEPSVAEAAGVVEEADPGNAEEATEADEEAQSDEEPPRITADFLDDL
ncbi:hypothetical protein [Aurantiacibacter odishensis]|uniref:hypothetical protein n=1 Tax=Aurantiacibacter odishensis TaxID=1155476 RepID=UPI000E76B170|nr:hypothetical protein [Aurantiacibacter odishensis]